MDARHTDVELPGFRFHPTEEELLEFYLKKMVSGKNTHREIIAYLNIYLYDPWVLPGLSKVGEREWYFFVPRDRKHGSGGRPNRTTENGFWKATGSDRKIVSFSDKKKVIGLRKTLVFYKGRAPRGSKTDWVMNEYRLPDSYPLAKGIVLCKIYRKATSMKVLEQRAAIEEETKRNEERIPLSPEKTISCYTQSDDQASPETPLQSGQIALDNKDEFHQALQLFFDKNQEIESPPPTVTSLESCQMASENHSMFGLGLQFTLNQQLKEEPDVISNTSSTNSDTNNKVQSLKLPIGEGLLQELQLPKNNMDWTQDSFWTQLCSPWLDNIMLSSPYANILNF